MKQKIHKLVKQAGKYAVKQQTVDERDIIFFLGVILLVSGICGIAGPYWALVVAGALLVALAVRGEKK